MKKIKIFIIVIMVLFVSGCGSTKSLVDTTNLREVLDEYKFDLYDTKEQIGYAEEALYGSRNGITVNFVKATKKYDVQGVFLDECKNVYSVIGNDYKKETDGGKNWTYLIVKNSSDYYFVGWIEDSYIIIHAPISQEKSMNTLAKKLGFK